MPAADETDALYRVAYDEAVRALAEQQALIESLRARAGLLLSAAAIATSFLGSQALAGSNRGPLVWLALVAFCAVAGLDLAILWPRHWELTSDPGELIRDFIETPEPSSVGQLHRDLAIYMREGVARNQPGLDRLAVMLQMASSLFAVEVVLWIVSLALTP